MNGLNDLNDLNGYSVGELNFCFHWGKEVSKRRNDSTSEAKMANETGGDVLNRAQAEKELYPARGLPGGGQLEIRMEISAITVRRSRTACVG